MFNRVSDLWYDHIELSVAEIVLIGLIALVIDFLFNYLELYMLREDIKECGWHDKKLCKVPLSITLIPLYCKAPQKNFYMIYCIVLNTFNIASAFVSLTGFFFSIATHAAGWSIFLLGASIYTCLLIEFLNLIPGALFVPSERKRFPVINWLYDIISKRK